MKKLRKYARAALVRLEALLNEYNSIQEPEILHDVRVEVKKIKSVLNLIGECSKGFKSHKHFLPFREIFRKAGEVREPEVASQVASRYGIAQVSPVRTEQTSEVAGELLRFDIEVFNERLHRERREILGAAKRVTTKEFKRAVKDLEKRVRKLLWPKVIKTRMHIARKRMKQLLYLSQVTQVISKKDKHFLTAAGELFGEFHDKQNLLNSVGARAQGTGRVREAMRKEMKAIRKLVKDYYGGK